MAQGSSLPMEPGGRNPVRIVIMTGRKISKACELDINSAGLERLDEIDRPLNLDGAWEREWDNKVPATICGAPVTIGVIVRKSEHESEEYRKMTENDNDGNGSNGNDDDSDSDDLPESMGRFDAALDAISHPLNSDGAWEGEWDYDVPAAIDEVPDTFRVVVRNSKHELEEYEKMTDDDDSDSDSDSDSDDIPESMEWFDAALDAISCPLSSDGTWEGEWNYSLPATIDDILATFEVGIVKKNKHELEEYKKMTDSTSDNTSNDDHRGSGDDSSGDFN